MRQARDPLLCAIIKIQRALSKLPTEAHRLWALGSVANAFGLPDEAYLIAKEIVRRAQEKANG